MNRRTFVETISAAFLTARLGFLGDGGVLTYAGSNSSISDAENGRKLIPIPISTAGVRKAVINLAGVWKFTVTPPAEFWRRDQDVSTWSNVEMPNEFAMLGFSIAPNTEYPCRRQIQIPSDYEKQRIFLRFDGVYGYARVWVNGVYIRDHFGGFTSWDCEITDHVKAGETADLVVGVTDRSDDISQASCYAKHSIAGILRQVQLFAVPQIHLSSLSTSAMLDSHYENGVLRVAAQLSSQEYNSAQLHLKLIDESDKSLLLERNIVSASPRRTLEAQEIVVRAPKRWDAEHPDLYLFELTLVIDGQAVETLQRKVGFRTVQRLGNQLLVNGQPVKLFGACRHSIHPIYGRAVPAEFDEKDAVLFRAANINFVRTSHYPPTEQFLDACDRHGIYVEEETAVCWSTVENGPSSNPAFTERFLSQFQEMIQRDQDHASVLFWSLGNESHWGDNFAAEHQYAAEHDPAWPVIFSYPDTVPMGVNGYDIYSKHYADDASDLRSDNYPLLNDEYAHISCYNLDTLRRDPGVRNFWGGSIKRFGDAFLAADGCLGGSIWAGIDEVFLLPEGPVGYGPWGLIDGWRRSKPEYWLAKKAYSPIRIDDRPISAPQPGNSLTVPILNAFNHTNLKDIEIRWTVGSQSERLNAGDIPPHGRGYLEIPPRTWKKGEILELQFHMKGKLIDQFRLEIEPESPSLPKMPTATATLRQTVDAMLVTGPKFLVTLNKTTGLVTRATFNDQLVLEGGPFLDLGEGPLSSHWLLRNCEATVDDGTVTIRTAGECKRGQGIETIPVEFEIEIDGSGLITTRYQTQAKPSGYAQLGITYLLPSNVDRLTWNRKSLWSIYPEDHIGRTKGVALKKTNHAAAIYREKPDWPWSEDMGDFFLWGKEDSSSWATNDFRSLKENIWYAACSSTGSDVGVRAEAEADIAVRASVQPDGRISFSLYNFWSYPDLDWGNFTGSTAIPDVTSQEVRLRLTNIREE